MTRSSFHYLRLLILTCSALLSAFSFGGWYKVEYFQTGQVHVVGPSGVPWDESFADTSDGGRGGSGVSQDSPTSLAGRAGSVECNDQITAKFTWVEAYGGELPPPSVVIRQVASASWLGDSGSCSDGLGGTPVTTMGGGASSKTIVKVRNSPGTLFYEACTPYAQASVGTTAITDNQSAGASVYYRAEAYAIYVNLLNTVDGVHTIVGQEIVGQLDYSASRYGASGNHTGILTFSSFDWTVSGPTFDHFHVIPPSQSEGYAVSVSTAELHSQNPTWIWKNYCSGNVAVEANVAINGIAASSTVSGSQAFDVIVPEYLFYATSASVVRYTWQGGVLRGAETGAILTSGIEFFGTITAPSTGVGSPPITYGGRGGFAQLIKRSTDINSGVIHNETDWDLDTMFPYRWLTFYADGIEHRDYDSPSYEHEVAVIAMDLEWNFDMYMLYKPDGPSDWTPLAHIPWDWKVKFEEDSGTLPPETTIGSITIGDRNDEKAHPEWHRKAVGSYNPPPPSGGVPQ